MGNLNLTHIEFKGEKGRTYAALNPGTTWTQAKTTAEHVAAVTDAPAKPVRRK